MIKYMNKKSKIDRIITESINKLINEKFKSKTLTNLWKNPSARKYNFHGGHSFRSQEWNDDADIQGIPNQDTGLASGWWLDKITDDMILTVGTRDELLSKGFKFGSHKTWYGIGSREVYDSNGSRCFAIILNNGKFIVFKNDPSTLEKIKQLSDEAGLKNNERKSNERYQKNDTYQWSTQDRGSAFHDWKTTQPLWDSEEFRNRKDVNVPKDWRNQDTWLKRNMDKAIKSYGREK